MQKECEKCGAYFKFKDGEDWKKICINCWIKSKNFTGNQTKNTSLNFDQEMLKLLIMLCHPDKHNNSPASTKVTAYLLSLRK